VGIMEFGHLIRKNAYIRRINLKNLPIFKGIEIETINRCNGKCAFCPVNVNEPQREYAKMTTDLFKKIIKDLASIDYAGEICLSSNNEPFLDDRMPDFIQYTRENLPKAFIYLWTNGTIVTCDTLIDVLPNLNRLYIDDYSDDAKLSEKAVSIIDTLKSAGYSDDIKVLNDMKHLDGAKILVLNRNVNEVLSSRGGQAPNKKTSEINDKKVCPVKCERIFENMIIRPTGKVSLCCCDALGVYDMGDVTKDRVSDVWFHSQEYIRVRKHMQKKGRKGLRLCEDCDFG